MRVRSVTLIRHVPSRDAARHTRCLRKSGWTIRCNRQLIKLEKPHNVIVATKQ